MNANIILTALLSILMRTQSEPVYYFLFEKVDNSVEIYFGDSLVYNTGVIESNPDTDLSFRFTRSDLRNRRITLKLINGTDPNDPYQEDEHWEIRYELFMNDEPIDYQWESGDDYQVGTVFTIEYGPSDL